MSIGLTFLSSITSPYIMLPPLKKVHGCLPDIHQHIPALKCIENFNNVGPSVVMASPIGLQSGLSRQLFEIWCSDKKNACVIHGNVVEGMLAKTIINEPKEVTLINGITASLNMHVHYISFSA